MATEQCDVSRLSDNELLGAVLSGGNRPADALAASLLARFGSLRALLTADPDSVCGHRGMGRRRYLKLMAACEIVSRHLREGLDRSAGLTSPDETRAFLRARLRDLPHELFCCLFLDNRHRVISFDELFRGTIDGASVYPREVVKLALARNAAAVILAHNHPSGVAEPSRADEAITRRLQNALALVDIRLLDHFIVGDTACVSFAERGLL